MGLMEKPQVIKKMHKFMHDTRKNGNQIGTNLRSVTLDYNNICNFKCEFCYEQEEQKYNKISLEFETIKSIADQADELGIWEVILQGGELLINKEILFKIIEAFKPERFRMILVTNGYLMTKELAKELADKGLDCIGFSISGMDAKEHDRSRGVKGSHERVLQAMEYAKEAGMTVWIQPIFGHHNSHDPELYKLLDYAKEKEYGIFFMLAMPYGVWKDNYMDIEDIKIFNALRKKYNCWFDTWDYYDKDRERITGCWSVNRLFITPKGDVLPCPFINIKIGNVKEQSLKEIIEYGFKIKYFREYSPICIAAQNRVFREKYLHENATSMFEPPEAKDIFEEEDFIK